MSFPQVKTAVPGRNLPGLGWLLGWIVGGAGLVMGAESNTPCARVEAVFLAARTALAAAPGSATNAVSLGRAAFVWADCATNDHQRAVIAEEAIQACRAAGVREPKYAAVPYYLAQNLGQLARTKSLGALKLVREMEKLWLRAQALDERLDFAGPDRSLGLVYLEAPGWPTSIGNHAKSRTHLERAVRLAPDYPDNRLALAEAQLRWHKREELAGQLAALAELWPRAQARLSGPEWEASWSEWESRLAALKNSLKKRSATAAGATRDRRVGAAD